MDPVGEIILEEKLKPSATLRVLVGLLSVSALIIIYLFQQTDIAAKIGIRGSAIDHFLFNRTIRFLLNDLFAIGLIFSLFVERKFVLFSVYVQLAGLVLFLIPYFILKIQFPAYNGPLISFLHRLILNPTLLLLLIPAFYYQKNQSGKSQRDHTN
jgi:exosortase F-associated protein